MKTLHEIYLDKASDFADAAHQLIRKKYHVESLHPIGFLASHAIELALKAYLLSRGWTEDGVRSRKKFGHNIKMGWREARALGLGLQEDLPIGVKWLVEGHHAPYAYRYPGKDAQVVEELEELEDLNDYLFEFLELVKKAISED